MVAPFVWAARVSVDLNDEAFEAVATVEVRDHNAVLDWRNLRCRKLMGHMMTDGLAILRRELNC